jgi:two-component system response regulator
MNREPVHFLLVEDDDDHAELITLGLMADPSLPKTVDRVRNGSEALAYLIKKGDYSGRPRPHVVLLDLGLLGVDGQGVLAAMKSDPEFRSIPVVVLTASQAPLQKANAYFHHANSYLVKPAQPGEFSEMIQTLARYWAGWNEATR